MTGFFVHRSNQIEQLVEVLAEVVAAPLADPFARECIVVQGKGMERWLAMQLAERLGVWANPDFPFPRRLLERAFAAVLGAQAPGDHFNPKVLTFAVARLLPGLVDRPELAEVRSYLDAEPTAARRLELAGRIAQAFDRYATHRPQMVAAWEGGAAGGWQAVLWRALVEALGPGHLAARAHAFIKEIGRGAGPIQGFPARVCLFALASLPPLYVDLLAALARRVEIHLFVPSPSREYWAEIRSHREILRQLRRSGLSITGGDGVDAADFDPDRDLHLSEGNPLLASFGTLGRDFQQVLEALGDYQEADRDLYRDPAADGVPSLLTAVQSDILHLRHRAAGRGAASADAAAPLPYVAGDRSISVHACHSEIREVEVLHDQLLALFDADATLAPHDVVVMTPRIDAYAPYVEAVFGSFSGPRIPFHIADRSARVDPWVSLFTRFLDLIASRMSASDVFELLEEEAVRRRFDIDVGGLDKVREWVNAAGIRWGVDAEHCAAHDQPALDQNTWRLGLDRLLLGYAMPGGGVELFGGVLPVDDVQGEEARLLGRFGDFCETLFDLRRELAAPRPVTQWCADLGFALDRLLKTGRGDDETAHPRRLLREALNDLATCASAADYDEPIDLAALRSQLDSHWEGALPSYGFLSGGVSFCDLVPMRSIPFRVVCLIGLSDGAFPRIARPPSFDLIAQKPMVGDRNGRDDDRYVFLEALLAARERLLITYVGQSVNDNADLPPSVVVAELLDYLDGAFVRDDCDLQVRERLVVRHPLQPFSPRYFGGDADPRLFSYAAAYCDGAQRLVGERIRRPPFVSAPLAAADESAGQRVDIAALARFFTHPVRRFFQGRLGIYTPEASAGLADREPADLVGLDAWKVGDPLVERALRGEAIDAAYASVAANGMLPPGTLGRCVFAALVPQAQAVAAAARPYVEGERLPAIEVDLEVAGVRIVGVLNDLWPRAQLAYSYSKLGRAREVRLWIQHLLLNAVAPADYPRQSHVCGRPDFEGGAHDVGFSPVAEPLPILARLVEIYQRGQSAPLPFFVKSSRRYADEIARSGDADKALRAARDLYRTQRSRGIEGEEDDPYIQIAFCDLDPLAATPFGLEGSYSFAALAEAVFAPLLRYRVELV